MGNESKIEFARRLRDAMTARGFVSRQARSGVDIQALATVAGTSYEMARRYAEGAAIPRTGKIKVIAKWLGVDPSSLVYGASDTHTVNLELLEKCLKAIAEAQERTGRMPGQEKTAHLVALLYQEAIDGRLPTTTTVDLLVKV